MKKKLVAVLLCIGLLNSAAQAVDIKIDKTGNKTSIGYTAKADEKVVLMVVRSDGSIKDNGSIVAVEYETADKNGSVGFEFGMPTDNAAKNDSKYDVYIKDGKEDFKLIQSMYYAIPESRERIVNELKSAKSAQEVLSVLKDDDNEIILRAVGCDVDGLNECDGEKIAELVFEKISGTDVLDTETVVNIINIAIGFEGINEKEDISEGLTAFDGVFEDTRYTEIDDEELKKHIIEYVSANKPYKDGEALEQAYAEANILYRLGKARVDEVESLLKKYADVLGIKDSDEYKKYAALSNTYKTNVNFVDKVNGTPISSTENLLTLLKNSIVTTSGGTSGGSSGSGSSGGSGGNSASVVGTMLPNTTTEQKIENNEEQNPSSTEFADMKDAEWASEAVGALSARGVVAGDENGNFRPNDMITREEFVKMLVSATGKYQKGFKCDFTDVPKDAWYYDYVASAYNDGIASGVSESEFGVGNKLTRQDMAVLCQRAVTDAEKTAPVRDDCKFADADEISEYARYAVSKLYMAGAINGMGDNMFKPKETATRAQCAVLVYNLFIK